MNPAGLRPAWPIRPVAGRAASAPRTLTTAQLINQQEALQASLTAQVTAASAQWAPAPRQAFAARSAAMVNDVLSDCMYAVHSAMIRSPGHTVRWDTYAAAALQARMQVDRHQQVALAMLPMHDPVAQLQQLDSGQILLLRAAPAITTLVLGGGGAKGMANAPALRALENLGQLTELKQVVGSSVGAMSAVLLASGMSPKLFQRLLNGTDMLSLLGTPADFRQRYPEITMGLLGFDAGLMLQTLDRLSGASVAHYLQRHGAQLAQQPAWQQCTAAQQQRLALLRTPDFTLPRSAQMLTFADLHLLHQLAPGHFRELVVTGWNQTAQRTVYFSHLTHPDMAVALAGRISAGIPVLCADVIWQGQRWRDGGVGSNMPSEAVLAGRGGQALAEAQARTLLMTFAEQGRVYEVLHAPPPLRRRRVHPLIRWLTGNPAYAQHVQADLDKVHAAGLMAMPVFHGDLELGAFHASAARVAGAKAQALAQSLAYIAQSRHNYRHDLVDNVDAAAVLLAPREQERFLARHEHDASALNAAMCAAIRRQQGETEAQRICAFAWASRAPVRDAGNRD